MTTNKTGRHKSYLIAVVCAAGIAGVAAVSALWHEPSPILKIESTSDASITVASSPAHASDTSQSIEDLVGGEVTRIGHEKGDPSVAEPDDYRMSDFRKPVPTTLKGARVISTAEAEELYSANNAIFLDVYPSPPKPKKLPKGTIWREPKHKTIKGALWMPNVGYGVLSPAFESYFRAGLKSVTGGDNAKTLIFFCLRDCWMSWNAAKRALEWGYSNVVWFPEGVDGWLEFNNETQKITAMKVAE